MKTLHQDQGRREGSMGFRRAGYRATSGVYNIGGFSPSGVVLSFLLYATSVASYLIQYSYLHLACLTELAAVYALCPPSSTSSSIVVRCPSHYLSTRGFQPTLRLRRTDKR